jgi:hypothetical protein
MHWQSKWAVPLVKWFCTENDVAWNTTFRATATAFSEIVLVYA